MADEREKGISITKGSRYRLLSAHSREKPMETVGIYRGFTSIGPDEAVVMELDETHGDMKGKLRVIPLHMILAIDVLEAVEEEEEKREPEKMYG